MLYLPSRHFWRVNTPVGIPSYTCEYGNAYRPNRSFQDRRFQKALDSILMSECFVFINSFSKIVFNKERDQTLKVDGAASTGSQGKFVSFWRSIMTALGTQTFFVCYACQQNLVSCNSKCKYTQSKHNFISHFC